MPQIEKLNDAQIEALSENQIVALITHYKNLLNIAKTPGFIPKLDMFLNRISRIHSESIAIQKVISDFKVDEIYPLLTYSIMGMRGMINKDELKDKIIPQLENIKLVDLIKNAQSPLIKKWVIAQLTENFLRNTDDFPDEYIRYIDVSKPETIKKITDKFLDNIENFPNECIKYIDVTQLERIDIIKLNMQQIKGLSPDQIKQLTEEQIQDLSQRQFQAFTAEQIEAFTAEQIKKFSLPIITYFTPDQIAYFTPMQIKNFSEAQIYTLSLKQIEKLTKNQLKSLDDKQASKLINKLKEILNNVTINDNDALILIKITHEMRSQSVKHEKRNKQIDDFQFKDIYPNLKKEIINRLNPQDKEVLKKQISGLNIELLQYLNDHADSDFLKNLANKEITDRETMSLDTLIEKADKYFQEEKQSYKARHEKTGPILLPSYLRIAIENKIKNLTDAELHANMKSKSTILQTMSYNELAERKKQAKAAQA